MSSGICAITSSGTFTLGLANSGVVAGTYQNATVTVDAKGRVTAIEEGTGGGTGGGTTLSNGVAVTGLAASTGNWTSDYTLVVPSGATNLKFAISGGTGDADMYVRLGSAPTTSSYTCRPYLTGNSETCTFAAPTAGSAVTRGGRRG